MDDLDAMASAAARDGDVAGLRSALDDGASPYPVMASSGGAAASWCADLVAAGPSDRLSTLTWQAAEADFARPGDGRHDHLLNLVTRCCRVDDLRASWRDATRDEIIGFHDNVRRALIYAGAAGENDYATPITDCVEAHRTWVAPDLAETVDLGQLFYDASWEGGEAAHRKLLTVIQSGVPSPQANHAALVHLIESETDEDDMNAWKKYLSGDRKIRGCTTFTDVLVTSIRKIDAPDPIAEAMRINHIGAAIKLAVEGGTTKSTAVSAWLVSSAGGDADLEGFVALTNSVPPLDRIDIRLLDDATDWLRSPDGHRTVAIAASARPDARVASWLALSLVGDARAYDGSTPCPPIPSRYRDDVLAVASEICARRPDESMRLLAALGAAADLEPVSDPAHLAVEAAADTRRAEAELAFRDAATSAQQASAAAEHGPVDVHHVVDHAAPAQQRPGRGR